MEDERETLEFPKKYPVCGACGHQYTIAQTVVDGVIAEGKAREEMKGWLAVHQALIVDSGKPWLIAPRLGCVIDACAKCGTLRAVEANVIMVTPGLPEHKAGEMGFSKN